MRCWPGRLKMLRFRPCCGAEIERASRIYLRVDKIWGLAEVLPPPVHDTGRKEGSAYSTLGKICVT